MDTSIQKRYENTNHAGMGSAMLVYMILMVLLITLAPFQFYWPKNIHFLWAFNPRDHIYNICLFIPLGFLFRLCTKAKSSFYWREILMGVVFSLVIEIAQSFVKGRTTAGHDVVVNGIGALIGAFLFDHSRIENESFPVPVWQMPLMTIIFLLIPLAWLVHAVSATPPAHLLLLIPLGIFGSGIIHSIYRRRIDPKGANPGRFFILSTTWFLIATFPSILEYFKQAMVIWVIVASAIIFQFLFCGSKVRSDKRFEIKTLRSLMPIYVIYLLALILFPVNADTLGLSGAVGAKLDAKLTLVSAFYIVESFSAFTLLGYMIVQMQSRKRKATRSSFLIVLLTSFALVFLSSAIDGKSQVTLSNPLIALFIIAGSLYGGLIYRLQLSSIKKINRRLACNS